MQLSGGGVLKFPWNACFVYEWMDWAIDTMDLAQELILESAQEYQDDDFFRYAGCVGPNLSSDPANLLSNGATNKCSQNRKTNRTPPYQSDKMPLTEV